VPLRDGVLEARVAAPAVEFTYRGGPLLTSVDVLTVFWGAAWNESALAPLADDLNAFFADVVDSPYLDQLAEYSTDEQTIGRGTFAGTQTLSNDPASAVVSDAEIQDVLQSALAAGELPEPGPNRLYALFVPPGVAVDLGGDLSCRVFCGYHNAIGNEVFYAVLPHPNCAGCLGGMSVLDSLTTTGSHELAEAVTDPVPGAGWYDDANGEIGDVCAWQTKQLDRWVVQLEWSNEAGACV